MRRFLLIVPLALLATVPQAQQKATRIGYVDVEKVVSALPGSKGYLDLANRSNKDLQAKQKNLQALVAKASRTGSAADRQAAAKAQQSLLSAQKNYSQRLATEFKPIATKVNSAVAKVAKTNGYYMVLNARVAASSNLLVYADSRADLTQATIKALK